MVADHDPAIGLDLPLDRGDHVPDRADLVIHIDPEVDLGRPRPDVVRERQAPLPARRDIRPAHRLEDRPRGVEADRQRGDGRVIVLADESGLLLPVLDRKDFRVGRGGPDKLVSLDLLILVGDREAVEGIDRQPLGPLDRRPVGGRGIARPQREELDAPPLERRAGPIRTVREDIPPAVAVVGRVGVDQDADRPSLLGVSDLQASEQLAVSDQDDLPFDVDAQLLQRDEILGPAEICVDDLARDVAGDAIAVEGGEGLGAGRILVGRNRVLHHLQLLGGRPEDLAEDFVVGVSRGVVEQDLVLDQVRVPAPRFELVPDVLGRFLVGGGPGDVGFLGQGPEPGPGGVGSGDGDGLGLGLRLGVLRAGREADPPLLSPGEIRERQQGEHPEKGWDRTSVHKKSPFLGEMLDRGAVREPNSAQRTEAFTKYGARPGESRPKASAVPSKNRS